MRSLASLILCMIVSSASVAQQGDDRFPRPASLQSSVAFWTGIYTEVNTESGLIHDARRLEIVYETIRFPPGSGRRVQERIIRKALQRYRTILRALAKAKRSKLDDEHDRVLRLWGADASPKTLRVAAKRLRFQRGQANRFREGVVRSGAWDEQIREIFRGLGLPEELAALPHVESSFHPLVRSHAGAAGLWQFTRTTGRRFMRIDHVVDERLDPIKSSIAAARLMQHNYNVLQSWPLALTAYNHGLSGVRRAVNSTGTKDIGTIVSRYNGRLFGFASRNFYAAFLAALDVSQNAERYFGKLQRDQPEAYPTVKLLVYVPADALANYFGIPIGALKKLNPPLQRTVWEGDKYIPKDYLLRLPRRVADQSASGRLERVVLAAGFPNQKPDHFYRVQSGDTLSGIAKHYNTSVGVLMAMNNLKSRHTIRSGQRLRLPGADLKPLLKPSPEVTDDGAPIRLVAIAVAESPPGDAAARAENTRTTEPPPGEESSAAPDEEESAAPDESEQPSLVRSDSVENPVETQPELSADPSDYEVADDATIEVQVGETWGHYAAWLETTATELRRLNKRRRGQQIVIGHRVKLDFSGAPKTLFTERRKAYHQQIQSAFFDVHRIVGSCNHRVSNGDTLWLLATRRYKVPLWLLRQYNPDVAFSTLLPPGGTILIPLVESIPGDNPDPTIRVTAAQHTCMASG